MLKTGYVIVNFGGPRCLEEISPFLQALLTDKDVIRTSLPQPIQNLIFGYIARRRARKIAKDYLSIGGKSPIYEDTEKVAQSIRQRVDIPVVTFHRYLPDTHQSFIDAVIHLADSCHELQIFPMFPQYTYATTGSIARWFDRFLPTSIIQKMRWVRSYPDHPAFIKAHQHSILSFVSKHALKVEETELLFSAHGIPESFVKEGDPYPSECQSSFQAIMQGLPGFSGRLCYQSKFGRGEWIKPYTIDLCNDLDRWISKEKKHVVMIPLSFTSDHIETLFEMEQEYMTRIRQQGRSAWRVPALTVNEEWIEAIVQILQDKKFSSNESLIRR